MEPYKWNDLSRADQGEARRLSQAADLPTASVSQVGKWLDSFRDYADGAITKAQLWERTEHAHGSPE